jgi:putative ABC transport system permease protein
MSDLLADLRFALRRWTKRPTFAITAILTLALGIGAATAIFSVVNGVLLRPLPWKAPDRLVAVWVARPQWRTDAALAADWNRGYLSWPMFQGLQEKRRTLETVGTYGVSQQILGGAPNELVTNLQVSASFLPMLGTQPSLGRVFSIEEDTTPTDAVLVTHETWVRRFGASPGILGTRVLLNGSPRAIVGVLPAGFRFGSVVPEFVIPFGNERDKGPGNHSMRGVARLRPGVTAEQAEADIAPVIQAGSTTEVKLPHVVALEHDQRGEFRRPLWMLMAAAVGLLLIACANVGGLLLGEAGVRRHEIAVRTAVGGSTSRLVRQLMVEALTLSSVAGLLGLTIAWYLTPLLLALSPLGLPPAASVGVGVDSGVLGFAVLLTIATSLLFGLGPSITLLRGSPSGALVEGGRDSAMRPQRAHGAIVAIQIALATVLLVTASLLGETVIRLSRVDTGFDPANLLVATVRSTTPLGSANLRAARTSETIAKLSSLPGVVSVAATAMPPFSGAYGTNAIKIEGKSHERDPEAVRQLITDDYFELMRIPLLKGQSLGSSEISGAPIAVVSSTFERQLMDGDALGKRFEWNKEWHTIVGVVPDAKQRAYTDPVAPMFYVLNRGFGTFLIRTAVAPESLMSAVREAIVSQDRGAVVSRLTTMNALLATSIAEERYRALLSSVFGFSALLLSAIGIYGIAARSVTDRLREFGVRSALGATPRNIRILVLGQSARLVGLGLLLGIPTALVTSRAIGAMLYGVSPAAPHTFVMVTAVLAAAASMGTFVPVHRAGRVDPAVALRQG